jgi:hypothetical protein
VNPYVLRAAWRQRKDNAAIELNCLMWDEPSASDAHVARTLRREHTPGDD